MTQNSDEIDSPSDISEVSLDQIDPTSNSNNKLVDYNKNLNNISTSLLLSSWLQSQGTVTFFSVILENKRRELINDAIRIAGSSNPNNSWINKNLNQVEIIDGLRDLVLEHISKQNSKET